MNNTKRWVICRKEKNCKRCKNIIKIDSRCWRYGSAYHPFFMCIECRKGEEIKNFADIMDRKHTEMLKYNLSEDEWESWKDKMTDSKVSNRWVRIESAIRQHNNPNSPYFNKKYDRIRQVANELFVLGIPKKIIIKKMVDVYEETKKEAKKNLSVSVVS